MSGVTVTGTGTEFVKQFKAEIEAKIAAKNRISISRSNLACLGLVIVGIALCVIAIIANHNDLSWGRPLLFVGASVAVTGVVFSIWKVIFHFLNDKNSFWVSERLLPRRLMLDSIKNEHTGND